MLPDNWQLGKCSSFRCGQRNEPGILSLTC
jgi:hypothetical protein